LKTESRIRTFEFKPLDRANLFEGLPFISYDVFVRRDPTMQNIIFRDLLKVLIDKAQTLKSSLTNKQKVNQPKKILISSLI
jgi:hypothetical protein